MPTTASPRFLQRANLHADLSLRTRRPPSEYVSLLTKTEQEFRSYIHSLEGDPAFQRLVREGAITKVRLRGRIPREKYEEYMDHALVAFLRDFGITQHDGWERDFLAPHALSNTAELARKYEVPLGILTRHLRYLRTSSSGLSPQRLHLNFYDNGHDTTTLSTEETVTGSMLIDLTETIERTREFVERYDVSEQDFLSLVLNGEATPEILAERFGCSLREAEEVLEDADRIYLAENWDANAFSAGANLDKSRIAREPVALVRVEAGRLAVQFQHDSVYAQRYRIQQHVAEQSEESAATDNDSAADSGGEAGKGEAGGGESEIGSAVPARDLLLRARYVNQRLSVLSRLIVAVCEQQIEYFETGDTRRLKPLAQADVARHLGEHPSTVSRLIRDKTVETPYGRVPLSFLCQSKTDVVARLVAAHPSLTDQDIVSKLREEHDCHIARRTVAYHRGKRLRRNQRRKSEAASTATRSASARRK